MMGKWRLLQEHFWGNSYHRLEVLCDATYKLLKTFLTTLDRNTCYMNMSVSNIRSWLKEPLVCVFACSFCLFPLTIFLKVFYVYAPNLFKWHSLANYLYTFDPGGWVTPRKIWWRRAARIPKPLPYLWPKYVIFPTPFMTWPEIWYPVCDSLWLTQTKFLKKGGKF